MHEWMLSALADATGLSIEELESRHEAGETHLEIAESLGLSAEEVQALMDSVHESVLDDAVANGWMTAEQAEWMGSHMDQMWRGDYGESNYKGQCGGGRW